MKVVIMAGGKGTRISSVASDIPKPMIKIEGTPVLEREIECLKEQGFDDILITVSHLGNIIMDYFGDGSGNSPVTGQPFGVHIEYYFEREPLGNAGALFKIKDKLTEDFLLLNINQMISDVKPDLLVACFGCPKQEKWIYENIGKYDAKVSVCAGATVDFLAGNVKRAPRWMSEHGLEWFYRFLQEPKRMFKRYFVDDIKILKLISKYR